MQLIVGLGNPSDEYNFTRHNFGFLALDFYLKLRHLEWQKPKMNAIWCKIDDKIFLKPQTFYNNSGTAVKQYLNYYKIPLENLLVICDDFDLNFGETRFRAKGSSGGNNGLKSINSQLHSENFARLRLGTGNQALRERLGDVDFVLSRFTPAEKAELPKILQSAFEKLQNWSGQ